MNEQTVKVFILNFIQLPGTSLLYSAIRVSTVFSGIFNLCSAYIEGRTLRCLVSDEYKKLRWGPVPHSGLNEMLLSTAARLLDSSSVLGLHMDSRKTQTASI
jgi:hypothetical protein